MDEFLCPRCSSVLGSTGERLECAACRGVFVEQQVIGSLFETLRAGSVPIADGGSPYRSAVRSSAPPVQDATRYLPCPICQKLMNRTRLGSAKQRFVVDVCLAHGVWFDGGELASAAAILGQADRELDAQVGQLLALYLKRRPVGP
jgi:Zn-finger nucleic acid-binding protein